MVIRSPVATTGSRADPATSWRWPCAWGPQEPLLERQRSEAASAVLP
jgi:hypothetical protein